jgi:serine/threonine-protein kinase HipA
MSMQSSRTLTHRATPRRPTTYRIAELLGSLQGEGRPVADFLRRLTFTVLLGENDAHATNLAILHLPGRSMLADVYDAVPSLFQDGRIDCNLALAIDGSFDHRGISAAHLIRGAEHWNALSAGEPEQIVTATLADFAKALEAGGRARSAYMAPLMIHWGCCMFRAQ